MSVEKSEHPYWNRFAESILYIIFDEVSVPCILYLRAVFILASYLESDSINYAMLLFPKYSFSGFAQKKVQIFPKNAQRIVQKLYI